MKLSVASTLLPLELCCISDPPLSGLAPQSRGHLDDDWYAAKIMCMCVEEGHHTNHECQSKRLPELMHMNVIYIAPFPGPHPASRRLQYGTSDGKLGEGLGTRLPYICITFTKQINPSFTLFLFLYYYIVGY